MHTPHERACESTRQACQRTKKGCRREAGDHKTHRSRCVGAFMPYYALSSRALTHMQYRFSRLSHRFDRTFFPSFEAAAAAAGVVTETTRCSLACAKFDLIGRILPCTISVTHMYNKIAVQKREKHLLKDEKVFTRPSLCLK